MNNIDSKKDDKKNNFYKYVKGNLFKRMRDSFNVALGLILSGDKEAASKTITGLAHDLDTPVKSLYFADYNNSMDLCAEVASLLLEEITVFILVDTLTDRYFKSFLQLFKQENEFFDSLVTDYSLSSNKLSSNTHLFIVGLEGNDSIFIKNELVPLTDGFFDARGMEL